MIWVSVFSAKLLLCFAALGLALHIGSCILAAVGRPRRRRALREDAGITLLLPLYGGSARHGQSLRSAFAELYPHKEIIFCAAAESAAELRDIRAVREENSAIPSLLIAAPPRQDCTAAADVRQSMAQGFKAARYDLVATALPNAVLPADYLARFLSRAGESKGEGAPMLICAPLWGTNPRGLRARLKAVFLNSFRARRLALADKFGCAPAAGGISPCGLGAALWHYDALLKAGGIDVFLQKAAAEGEAAAATALIRAAGGKIRLTARPLPVPLGGCCLSAQGIKRARLSLRRLPADETAWLRCYRRFAPRLFYAEALLAPLLPMLACAAAWGLGAVPLGGFLGFIGLWYAVELLFSALWGAGSSGGIKTWALLPLRDCLLPFFWLYAACAR